MDAKVLRAAVTAAIRVTMSTTLVGCGNTVSDQARPSEASGSESSAGSAMSGGTGSAMSSVGGDPRGGGIGQAGAVVDVVDVGGAAPSSGGSPSSSAGGQPSTTPGIGGTSSPGGTDAAGQSPGGTEGEAGAPALACGASVLDCLSALEMVERGALLDETGMACCVTVRAGLIELKQESAECYLGIAKRFQSAPARQACCKDPSTWDETACAPWGPPVPPELRLEVLRAWAAVA